MTASGIPKEAVKAIVFDLDGTLYQDDRLGEQVNLCACRYVAELKCLSVDQADTLLEKTRDSLSGTGRTLSRSVTTLGGNLKELHDRLSREVHPEGLLKLDPRVPELLKRLAGRFDLHLYTNNNRELSARIMAEIGVSGCFQQVFSIEDYWLPKPDQVVLEKIFQSIKREPFETLFVGDRYGVDLALPQTLGCPVYESRTVDELLRLAELLD